jgi:hypothetical protein
MISGMLAGTLAAAVPVQLRMYLPAPKDEAAN